MRKCAPSFVVYKWKDNTFSQAITCANSITANVFEMKQYFFRINPTFEEKGLWSTIHAGHDEPTKAIKDNSTFWFRAKNSGMFKKNLQFHNTSKHLWLLWSHERMDTNALKEELEKRSTALYGKKLPMALTLTYVKDRTPFGKKRQDDLKALHIESPTEKLGKTKKLISYLYGYNSKHRPLGIRMRYVTAVKGSITSNTKREVLRLRTKKNAF